MTSFLSCFIIFFKFHPVAAKNALICGESLTLKNGESKIINKDHLKLIITYSDSQAKERPKQPRKRLG